MTLVDRKIGREDLTAELARFDITPQRWFLPAGDPLRALPGVFSAWEQIAADLPKLLMTDQLRAIVERMPLLEVIRPKGASPAAVAM